MRRYALYRVPILVKAALINFFYISIVEMTSVCAVQQPCDLRKNDVTIKLIHILNHVYTITAEAN